MELIQGDKETTINNYRYEIEKEREKIKPNWIYISYCIDCIKNIKDE